MKDTNPLVTVLIPAYNVEDYVMESIISITQQSYKNLEILIVEDCSTDRTLELLRNIEDPRIKILTNEENKGVAYTLNRGLKEAQGEYIARHDSDDVSYTTRIEKQVRFMEENPQVIVLGTGYDVLHQDKTITTEIPELSSLSALYRCPVHHPSTMYRREFVEEHYCSYEGIAEDFTFWNQIFKANTYHPQTFINLKEPLFRYTLRGNQQTSVFLDEIISFHNEGSKRYFLKYCLKNGLKIKLKDDYTVENIRQLVREWNNWDKPDDYSQEDYENLYNRLIHKIIFREFEKRSLPELVSAYAHSGLAKPRSMASLIKRYIWHRYFNIKSY